MLATPLLLSLLGTVGLVLGQHCQTLKDSSNNQNEYTYSCEPHPFGCSAAPVAYGTLQYHEDSHVCVAAVHAGAITAAEGGTFSVKKIGSNNKPSRVFGTVRNQVESTSEDVHSDNKVYKIIRTNPTVTAEDLAPDVVVVHNSYQSSDATLHLACLSQDPAHRLSQHSINRWNYATYNAEKMTRLITEAKAERLVLRTKNENLHAFRCLGRNPATDVLAIMHTAEADYWSPNATVRLSKGDRTSLQVVKARSGLPDEVFWKRLPDGWSASAQEKYELDGAQPHDSGIFIAHSSNAEKPRNFKGAFFDLMVRDCEDGKYGIDCSQVCVDCYNGGVCHTEAGTCMCPPGFIGDQCEHACLPGWFGHDCQYSCQRGTLGFDSDDHNNCAGLTFCLPVPYGCSCGPGFTFNLAQVSSTPVCTAACGAGRFGSDCSQECWWCQNQQCDPFTGTCTNGCGAAAGPEDCVPAPAEASISSKNDVTGELRLSWSSPGAAWGRVIYFVWYQFVKHLGCLREQREAIVYKKLSSPSLTIEDVQPYTQYQLCVVVSGGRGGHSPQHCINADTKAAAPEAQVTDVRCFERNSIIQCNVDLSEDCKRHNGPDFSVIISLKTELACYHPNKTLEAGFTPEHDGSRSVVGVFQQFLRGQTYQVTARARNQVSSTGQEKTTSVTTRAGKPPPVQNLTYGKLNDNDVHILWNDPCPSNGALTRYYISGDSISSGYKALEPCSTTNSYDRCHTFTGLQIGQSYTLQVQVSNSGGWSDPQGINFTFEETKPGPPAAIKSERGGRSLNLTLDLPVSPGGSLTNCTIFLPGQPPCHFTPQQSSPPPSCQFEQLEAGKMYEASSSCCNTKFCGETLVQMVATEPLPPVLSGGLQVLSKTNSTITLSLPTVTHYGQGERSLLIVVQDSNQTQEKIDVEKVIQKWQERQQGQGTRQERSVGPTSLPQTQASVKCSDSWWIADQLNQPYNGKVVVGDGRSRHGYVNCVLVYQHHYNLWLLALTELLGSVQHSWTSLSMVAVEPDEPRSSLYIIIIIIVLLLVLVLVVPAVVMYRKRRHADGSIGNMLRVKFRKEETADPLHPREEMKSGTDGNSVAENAANPQPRPAPTQPVYENRNADECENIYENVNAGEYENIYENLTRRVGRGAVEDYLNSSIGSSVTQEEFRSVPENVGKKMEIAKWEANRKKNRYRNNHPYDETRVQLTVVGGDPDSDYINANHVQGYGNTRYIASQGPKDTEFSTLMDFWRMLMEQNIDTVIMVANFFEEGKKKVGQYLNWEEPVCGEGYTVTVTHREQLPHFTRSTVKINYNNLEHVFTHYNYTSWPDHGVPTEARTLASMLTHYRQHCPSGGTLVHCSAGIGRTGTILQVLLMCEMLEQEYGVDPLEVLQRLRDSRARLVENYAQYNLSLQIFEEMLFGEATAIPPQDLMANIKKHTKRSVAEFTKIKSLHSSHTFVNSSHAEFLPMNRDASVLPADSCQIYLEVQNVQPESQYINAVSVAGLNRNVALIVTEHPLPSTLSKFWRLVAERRCSTLVLINEVHHQSKEEYPVVLPNPGESWTLEGCQVQVVLTQPLNTYVMQSTVNVTNAASQYYDDVCKVEVYQVLGWPQGEVLPPSPSTVVTIADLLLQRPQAPNMGPPLLCCSDGYTGCGLVAATTLVIERLQSDQVVDVYRTVVKLLRSRTQFITCQEQYAFLYTGAAEYIEEYSTYGNFS